MPNHQPTLYNEAQISDRQIQAAPLRVVREYGVQGLQVKYLNRTPQGALPPIESEHVSRIHT